MSLKFRPLRFTYYRLLFVVLLFSVGIICFMHLSISFLYGVSLITPALKSDHDAILAGAVVCGLLSTMFGFIMLNLLLDRRQQCTDRRQRQLAIDFPDRRSGGDRRVDVEMTYTSQTP